MVTLADKATSALRRARGIPQVRAACVLGSVARDEYDSSSDIDALVVVSSSDRDLAMFIRRRLPTRIAGHRVEMRVMTHERLAEIRDQRTVYAAHVAKESAIAFDRKRDLAALKHAFREGSRVEETGESLRKRLMLYDDLQWCNGHYLACFADIYAFGRAGAILVLARQGIYEFGRRAPLVALGARDSNLREACNVLVSIEPFYLRGRRSVNVQLPFSQRDSHAEAVRARNACAEILRSVP